jgi:hypothetical protein
MKKIKITLIMGPFLPVPALQGGAVEKLWFDLCKSLVGPEISITLISKKHSSLLNNEIVDGVRFLRIKGYKSVNTNFKRLSLDLIYSMRAVRARKRYRFNKQDTLKHLKVMSTYSKVNTPPSRKERLK